MKEVYPDIYVGSQEDIDKFAELMHQKMLEKPAVLNVPQFYIVHAAKEPWHRKALGYTTRGAPKEHPDYLWKELTQRIALNLVDVPESKAKFIPDALLDKAVAYIKWAHQEKNKPVFIHCNEGKSRAPSLALMYLIEETPAFARCQTFEEIESLYARTMYPGYEPQGIKLKVRERYERRNKDD